MKNHTGINLCISHKIATLDIQNRDLSIYLSVYLSIYITVIYSRKIECERSESDRERRIALYKSDQQHYKKFKHCFSEGR